jgi:hypothetical protein
MVEKTVAAKQRQKTKNKRANYLIEHRVQA